MGFGGHEGYQRVRYGMFRGHYKWDLAKAWFQMSNDSFYQRYGFNFVPEGSLFDEAKEFVNQ